MGPTSSFEIDILMEISSRNTEYEDFCTCRFASKMAIAKLFLLRSILESVKAFFTGVYNRNSNGFGRFKDNS